MAWALGKATSYGVCPTENCWPGHPLTAPSRKVWKGSSWFPPQGAGTYLSRRRLRFTFSALAIALAPTTPMELPRKLQRKVGGEEGQPGMAQWWP